MEQNLSFSEGTTTILTVITEARPGREAEIICVISGWLIPAMGDADHLRIGDKTYWYQTRDLVIDAYPDGKIRSVEARVSVKAVRNW